MTRILVTGATGAIGRHLLPELLKLGLEVRGQYNRQPGASRDAGWFQMDFLRDTNYGPLVEGCDAVIHLAAELRDASVMERVNVESTLALLAASQAEGVRYFGHASSIVAYGSPRQRIVSETTPILDPYSPMVRQYHAEPYMLEYARTKALAELKIRSFQPTISVDLYRLAIVADNERLFEAGNWTHIRKIGAAYRRTQYMFAPDAAAALAFLATQGISLSYRQPRIEAFNICDGDCGTFRDILNVVFEATGDRRFRLRADLPAVLDMAKDAVRYRNPVLRYPLGMLSFSNTKLLAAGFSPPTGVQLALKQAIELKLKAQQGAPAPISKEQQTAHSEA